MRLAEVVHEVEEPHVDAEMAEVHPEVEGVSETVAEVEAVVDRSQEAGEDRAEALAREEVASEDEDEKHFLFNGISWI